MDNIRRTLRNIKGRYSRKIFQKDIPESQRRADKEYKRRPGGGRKPLPKRQVLERILYVLRTGR